MKLVKYMPMILLCAVSVVGIINGFSYAHCIAIGLLGIVYVSLDFSDKYSALEDYKKEVNSLKLQLKEIQEDLQVLKVFASNIKLSQQNPFSSKRS